MSHKYKVRDILINRLDQNYYLKVLHIQDPCEMLKRIKELKQCETNITSVMVRSQLYSIQYIPNRETASQFWDRFEDIIRNFENTAADNSAKLSEDEKRDAFL